MPLCADIAWSQSGGTTSTTIVLDAESIPIPTGSTGIAVTLESWSLDGLALSGGVFIRFLAANGASLNGSVGATIASNSKTVPSVVLSQTYPVGTTRISWGYEIQAPGTVPPTGVSLSAAGVLSFTGACDAGPFCQYGTQLALGGAAAVGLTDGLISIALAAVDLGFLIPVFQVLIGYSWQTGVFCGGLPPGIPPAFAGAITDGTYPVLPSFADVLQFWEAISWPYFCKCKDAPLGSPIPTIPTIPVPVPPVSTGGGGTPIPIPPPTVPATCDNTDLCTILNTQLHLSQTINATVNSILSILTKQTPAPNHLLYSLGPTFSGLTLSGVLSAPTGVWAILGVIVYATTVPQGMGRDEAALVHYYHLGEIAFSTRDGYAAPVKIVHADQVEFTNVLNCTQLAYSFVPGVTGDIQLLLPPA